MISYFYRRGSLVAPMETSRPSASELYNLEPPVGKERAPDSLVTPGLVNELKQDKKRMIAKGGQCNITLKNVPHKRLSFFKDVFTTCVDMQWRFTFLAFAASFFISWLIFGVIYYIIALYRGDFLPDNLPSGKNQEDGSWKPCVWAIEDFASCFLFSVETQHTIG